MALFEGVLLRCCLVLLHKGSPGVPCDSILSGCTITLLCEENSVTRDVLAEGLNISGLCVSRVFGGEEDCFEAVGSAKCNHTLDVQAKILMSLIPVVKGFLKGKTMKACGFFAFVFERYQKKYTFLKKNVFFFKKAHIRNLPFSCWCRSAVTTVKNATVCGSLIT